jgi:hypothetical protein
MAVYDVCVCVCVVLALLRTTKDVPNARYIQVTMPRIPLVDADQAVHERLICTKYGGFMDIVDYQHCCTRPGAMSVLSDVLTHIHACTHTHTHAGRAEGVRT